MAKRSTHSESTYSPLDLSLARSVIQGPSTQTPSVASSVKAAVQADPVPSPAIQVAQTARNHRLRFVGREKRVLISVEDERQIERLVDRMGEWLNTSLTLSHVLRACMEVLSRAEREIQVQSEKVAPLRRPAHGNQLATAEFEQSLAKVISRALQDAPILR